MSADSEAVVQVNRPDDYSAQPPLKDVVAGPDTPPTAESAAVLAGVDDGVDAVSPPTDRHVASPVDQKHCIDSTTTPPPSRGDEPMEDVPYTANRDIEGLIKDEVLDLKNGPQFYGFKRLQLKIKSLNVGFARGLEPDHIVGATKQNEKLKFLVAWKNSIDGVADLLDADEIYEKCPEIAFKFFEDHLVPFDASEASNEKSD